MRNILIVGCGGFVGAILRYLLSGWLQNLSRSSFPYGTLGVNLLGCLALGLLGGWVENREFFSPATRLFLGLGLLGSFTTFSTFGYETHALLRDSDFGAAIANSALHVGGGLLAVWLGYAISNLR